MTEVTIRRYSLAFKHAVVREYEAGASASTLRRKYGIGCVSTVCRWVGQYGREGTRHRLMTIQKPEEQRRVQEQAARIQELEALVAQLALDKAMLEASLAVAEERLGEPVKKKAGRPSSTGRSRRRRR